MGRTLMYATLTVLAVFVLSATFLLEHGGGSIAASAEVSVHDLLLTPEIYKGRDVTTEGVLRFDQQMNTFVVTAEGQAIAVRYDATDLSPLKGQPVKVNGRFDVDQDSGVYIQANVVLAVPQ